ncbi:MAG: hypothetical protein ACOY0T_18260 [Myxococcota bacterium]
MNSLTSSVAFLRALRLGALPLALIACGGGEVTSGGSNGGRSSASGGESNAQSGGSASTTGGKNGGSGGAFSSTGGVSIGGSTSQAGGTSSGGTTSKGGSASTTPPTAGPHFQGTGNGFRPLTAGCGPETATQCTGTCERAGGSPGVQVIRPPATLCFSGDGDLTPKDPAVVIEQSIEKLNGQEYVHIRITFDPSFVDNTYGKGVCCGWPLPRGHSFPDLTRSDHTELLLTDATGALAMHFKIDFIDAKASAACRYGTLGAAGGDGTMIAGNPAHLLATATSLDRNLNGCGYCMNPACGPNGNCTVDSPTTDSAFTPNPSTPNWDYRQVYEVWIDMAAFNGKGFGQANITYTHASPSKGIDTITVTPSPCPPEWATPYCPPSVIQEGGNCGNGGNTPGCPPNYQLYLAAEGGNTCTPIPFSNWPGMTPCPTGFVLDVASEGQYCLPAK